MKNERFPLEIKAGSVRVKIYRVVEPNRERFTLTYHEGTRRKLKQFSTEADARREAKIIAGQLNAGQGAALELTGRDRDAYQFALEKLKSLGIGLAPAIEEYIDAKKEDVPLAVAAKFYRESHLIDLPDKTVQEVVEELLQAKKRDGASKAYLAPLKTCLSHF